MIIDNFKNNLKKVLEHTTFQDTLSRIDTESYPKIWRSQGHIRFFPERKQGTMILSNESAYFYYKFMKDFRKYCDDKNLYFSEQFLDKKVMELVEKFDGVDVDKEMLNFIQEFLCQFDKTNYHSYRIFLPINHYSYKEINLDKFQIKKLTKEDFFRYTEKMDKKFKQIYDLEYDSLTKHNETKTIAIIEVESIEEDDAIQKANNNLKKFIYAEKLFDVGSFVTPRTKHYSQVNESIGVFNKTAKTYSSSSHSHYIPTRVTPSNEFYQRLEPYRDKLYKFLFNTNLTSLQQSILSSMYWLGEVDILRDTNEKKYISYLTGLEKIAVKKHENQSKKKFALHMCALYKTPNEIPFYEEYYERRNQLLHDENLRIFDEQAFTLLSIMRRLLLEMIDHNEEYQNIEEFWLKQYDVQL